MTGWNPVQLLRDTVRSQKAATLTIGTKRASMLGLTDGQAVTAIAGGCQAKAAIVIKPSCEDDSVRMSGNLLSSLRLPGGIRLGMMMSDGSVRFGPIIAILADHRSTKGPFGEQNDFLKRLMSVASRRGYMAYVLTPGDSLANGLIGYRYIQGGWRRADVPAPDVCYDRCLALTHTQQTALSRAKRALTAKGVVIFNQTVGSKEQVHAYLSSKAQLSAFLPETRFANSAALMEMLRKHKVVYVKPSWGTQGRNVARLTKRRKGRAMVASFVKGGSVRSIVSSSPSILLRRLGLSEGRRLLVQQGIDLISVGNRLADIRVLVQRTGVGEWVVTGCAGRVGQAGSPVSNIHQGGGVFTCNKLLTTAFNSSEKVGSVLAQVEWLAVEVAKVLDEGRGQLGELGIDIGVDKKGRVWFIEANPRPGRTVFRHIGSPVTRSRSISRPVEFAAYLAAGKHAGKEQQNVEGTHSPY